LPSETSSLFYTQNGSTDEPSKLHGLTLIHRVSDTPDQNPVGNQPSQLVALDSSIVKTRRFVDLPYCWAHTLRKLHELTHNNVAPIAEEGLKKITAYYRIEEQARGQSADEHLNKTAPKIAAFKTWLVHARTQSPPNLQLVTPSNTLPNTGTG
jgi:hypothetical protein